MYYQILVEVVSHRWYFCSTSPETVVWRPIRVHIRYVY